MDRVCPLLALAADRRSVVDGVDSGHRCHAGEDPIPLERQQQAQVCLTPRHEQCERYLDHVARRGGIPGRAPIADGLVSTRVVLTPEPAWRGIAGRARTGRPGRALVIGFAIVGIGLVGAALAGPALTGGLSVLDAATSPAPTATTAPAASPAVATPTASATPAEMITPSPTSQPTPQPTPEATPAAAPQSTPEPATVAPPPVQQTYVVQAGDTLAEIAQQFGSTVQAIQAANAIEDPNEIAVGVVLVIP